MAPPVTNGVDHTDDDDVEIDYSDIIKKLVTYTHISWHRSLIDP